MRSKLVSDVGTPREARYAGLATMQTRPLPIRRATRVGSVTLPARMAMSIPSDTRSARASLSTNSRRTFGWAARNSVTPVHLEEIEEVRSRRDSNLSACHVAAFSQLDSGLGQRIHLLGTARVERLACVGDR